MQSDTAFKVQRMVAGFVLGAGLALMAMMIAVESEPGLLPLLMVLGGGAWSAVLYRRAGLRRG